MSPRYLDNGALYFTKVTEQNNIGFDRKIVEDEDSERMAKG